MFRVSTKKRKEAEAEAEAEAEEGHKNNRKKFQNVIYATFRQHYNTFVSVWVQDVE